MSRAWLAFLLKRDEKDLVLVLEGLIDSWEGKSPAVRSCKPKKLQVQALWVLPSGPYPVLWVLRQRSLARMLQEDLLQVGAEARRKALEVCPHRRHELPQNSLKLTRGPHNPHCSPLYLSSEHLPAQIFPLQNPTPGGYLRGLPFSRLHTQDPWGSFGSQRQKEAQAGRGVRAKTVGTRRTLGPREREQRAQGEQEGDQPQGDGVYNCHFRRLDFPGRPPQTFAGRGPARARAAPFLPPPAADSSRIRTRRTPGSDWKIRAREAARLCWKATGACAVAGERRARDRAPFRAWRGPSPLLPPPEDPSAHVPVWWSQCEVPGSPSQNPQRADWKGRFLSPSSFSPPTE